MAKENFEEYLKVKDLLIGFEHYFHMTGLAKEFNFVLREFVECLNNIKEIGEITQDFIKRIADGESVIEVCIDMGNKFREIENFDSAKLKLIGELDILYFKINKGRKEAK